MYQLGGLGVDVKLHSMACTDDIVWVSGNSYVRVAPAHPEYDEGYLFTNDFGQTYRIYSVNGIGEIRWTINNTYDVSQYHPENLTVVKYFKTRRSN